MRFAKSHEKECPLGLRELEGIRFIHDYKYLGLLLDQSLTLKYLVPMLKGRIKSFLEKSAPDTPQFSELRHRIATLAVLR